MERIYLDHAAATPVRPEVLEAMLPYFTQRFGNPSAVYDLGAEIKEVIEAHRAKVAQLIGGRPKGLFLLPPGPKPTTWPSRARRWPT